MDIYRVRNTISSGEKLHKQKKKNDGGKNLAQQRKKPMHSMTHRSSRVSSSISEATH